MAIFKQRESRFWWISIYTGKGKPRRYIPTHTEHEDIARAMEANLKSAMRGNLPRERFMQAVDAVMGWDTSGAAGIPVSDLWTIYLQTKPRAGKDSLNRRRRIAADFTSWLAKECLAIRWLHDITPQHACAYADQLAASRAVSGKTFNNLVGNLKTIFSAVAARSNLRSNPFEFVERANENDGQHGRAWSPDEEKRLFEEAVKAGNNWAEIQTIARYTGLRYKDVATLRPEQVFADRIELEPAKTKKHGIAVRIPLHPKAAAALASLDHSGEYLFPSHARRYYNGFQKPSGYMEIIKAAKIKPGKAVVSFHCWCHTFRTRLAAANVPQEVAMKLGGWTEQSTAEIYNHDFTQMTAAINALD